VSCSYNNQSSNNIVFQDGSKKGIDAAFYEDYFAEENVPGEVFGRVQFDEGGAKHANTFPVKNGSIIDTTNSLDVSVILLTGTLINIYQNIHIRSFLYPQRIVLRQILMTFRSITMISKIVGLREHITLEILIM